MSSSNDLLREFARAATTASDPGFVAVVAFDYYDGPERGIALYPSGEGVRFSSLGDSKSRLFRAFEMIPIGGNWGEEVNALRQATSDGLLPRVLVPLEASDGLARLERNVFSAPAGGFYVGVGSPDFAQIYVSAVTKDQLDDLRQLGCSPAGFQSAHRLVKGRALRCG